MRTILTSSRALRQALIIGFIAVLPIGSISSHWSQSHRVVYNLGTTRATLAIPLITQLATSAVLPNVIIANFTSSTQWTPPIYSLDGGFTWQEVATQPWSTSTIAQVAIAPRADSIFPVRLLVLVNGQASYLGGGAGLYRSADFGQTWGRAEIGVFDEQGRMFYNDLTASAVYPQRLYLTQGFLGYFSSGDLYCGTFASSNDAGVTWTEFLTGCNGRAYSQLRVSPVFTDRVYTYRFDQYGSDHWQVSDNGGQDWVTKTFPGGLAALDSQDPNWLYAIGQSSLDAGNQWQAWKEQPCLVVEQLVADPSLTQALFVRCETGLYRSLDGGDSWNSLSAEKGEFLAADYGLGGLLWVKNGMLWASTDQGATWNFRSILFPITRYFLPIMTR